MMASVTEDSKQSPQQAAYGAAPNPFSMTPHPQDKTHKKGNETMQPTVKTRQILAAVIGNALEWYDFVVYGFMTVILSRLFFPSDSEYASLLIAMATFGVGFFMRPVGGILIGMYADRRGRKAALQLIILLMTVSIAMIAFAPT